MHNTRHKWPRFSAVAMPALLFAGCNGTTENTAQNGAGITEKPVVITHTPVPRQDKSGAAPRELAAFFPGATLKKKPVTFNSALAGRLSKRAGLKFSGKEGDWQFYEAWRGGRRIGMAVLTHSNSPGGSDLDIAFAVDPRFKIINATAVEAPSTPRLTQFIRQTAGKDRKAAFKVGQDLKMAPGLTPAVAQLAADAVHKGIVMLDEFFKPTT